MGGGSTSARSLVVNKMQCVLYGEVTKIVYAS